ncbi:serine/threonine-protein kinase TTK/MPS1 [Schistosoma bovis]|uniref:Serine/threonine-protein kinase TTK/MPS1 n=1 Tax=Schistosoma bovis TaxID=6184 RepID=A0A430QG38_SCHBO|nr:serine/threonine-protein kinase TTK/MPS1 [Schistosoma bovis]
MLLPNVSRDLQIAIFKAYPKNIKSRNDWFSFLNHMERKVRSLDRESTATNILLNLYKSAVDSLEVDWSDEIYLTIFIRTAVLASYENSDCGPAFLSLCSINGRRNPQLIAAVAYYYSKQGKYLIIISSLKFPGDKSRAKSLLNSTKKCVDICGVELLCRAESMLDTDDDFKSLLGPFYYKPDFYFQGEIFMDSYNFSRSLKLPGLPEELSVTSVTSNPHMESLQQPELSTIVGSIKLNGSCEKDKKLISVGVQTELVNESEQFIIVNGKKYQVINELGRGGSSVVYWAMDSDLNPWAVKKVDLKNLTQETVTSYINEIEMLKSLINSDRIIRLYDYHCTSENLILVMEKGDCDLKSVILSFWSGGAKKSPRSPSGMLSSGIVFYWDQMLRCVKALHDRRIVHLDLKPQNFVLVYGQLKLIDLGISRLLPDDSTTVNHWLKLGTLSFMSPEQLEEAAAIPSSSSSLNQSFFLGPEVDQENRFKVGRKSDIWSLGVILYMMVYGQLPFNQDKLHSRLSAIISPSVKISLPAIKNKSIYKALERSLVRNHLERASVDELLSYEYVSSTSAADLW